MPSRPTFTCNTAQDLPIRSEYVHVIGAEVWNKLFNNVPHRNYLISLSPPLNRIEIQVLQSLPGPIGHSLHPGDVFCK